MMNCCKCGIERHVHAGTWYGHIKAGGGEDWYCSACTPIVALTWTPDQVEAIDKGLKAWFGELFDGSPAKMVVPPLEPKS